MSSNNSSNAGEGDVCNKKSTFKPEETVKEIIEIEEVEEVAGMYNKISQYYEMLIF